MIEGHGLDDCLMDIESQKTAIDVPKLILKYQNNVLVFVYKNSYGRSWLEYTPNIHSKEQDMDLLNRFGVQLESPLDYNRDGSFSHISVNIQDEEDFLAENMDYII